ncbi:MAG: RluA family pseudouridine synthase, partial [Kiritimatiellae bacterium]|nr:RluA family pseudouridine synthase [Kiritimatiellia bacterium]
EVTIPPVAPVEVTGENIPLDGVYEDSDIIVVNKPAGLVVHPAAGHPSGTLVNALLYHCSDLAGVGGEMRPGIVHRLDKDTSGVMVAVKNERAMNILARQFKNNRVGKEYVAVVHGIPDPRSGRIETLIGRSGSDRKKMSVAPVSKGRVAITNYEVVEEFGDFCLVRLKIETGRTHQIRVHMAHIGHPVAGDGQYGGRKTLKHDELHPARQMLHAAVLSFNHPGTNKRVTFKAPIPDEIKEFITRLRH